MFDLRFGLLAKNYVGYTSPDLKKSLGVEFPEGLFFSPTPVGVYLGGWGWGPQGSGTLCICAVAGPAWAMLGDVLRSFSHRFTLRYVRTEGRAHERKP